MAEGTIPVQYQSAGIFIVQLQTAAGMTGDRVSAAPFKHNCRLLFAEARMVGAGASGDTVKIQRLVPPSTRTDVSPAADVSAIADNGPVPFATLDDAQMDFDAGDSVEVLTASDALARVTLWFAER
jgi:hypothetical protein